jgi:aryl-alcohol dehydrogenase-like predicted oxidoreductase
VTVAQLALARLLAQGEQIVPIPIPIPGTRSPRRLAENVGAARVELTETVLKRVQEVSRTERTGPVTRPR